MIKVGVLSFGWEAEYRRSVVGFTVKLGDWYGWQYDGIERGPLIEIELFGRTLKIVDRVKRIPLPEYVAEKSEEAFRR